MNRIIILACVCMFNFLYGEIVETKKIETVKNSVTDNSLVFFNITGTLYTHSNTLSDSRWREYFSQFVHENIEEPAVADALVNKVKGLIVNNIPKRPVETVTVEIIQELQERHIPVLGITRKYVSPAYAGNFAEITSSHLKSLGYNLEKTLTYLQLTETLNVDAGQLAYGMLFTNKKPEGPAVLALLSILKNKPGHIVMVDNTQESLMDVEHALAGSGISFTGFLYTAAEGDWDPDLGTIEFLEFVQTGKILSDEEAMQIKNLQSDAQYPEQLKEYILGLLEGDHSL